MFEAMERVSDRTGRSARCGQIAMELGEPMLVVSEMLKHLARIGFVNSVTGREPKRAKKPALRLVAK